MPSVTDQLVFLFVQYTMLLLLAFQAQRCMRTRHDGCSEMHYASASSVDYVLIVTHHHEKDVDTHWHDPLVSFVVGGLYLYENS